MVKRNYIKTIRLNRTEYNNLDNYLSSSVKSNGYMIAKILPQKYIIDKTDMKISELREDNRHNALRLFDGPNIFRTINKMLMRGVCLKDVNKYCRTTYNSWKKYLSPDDKRYLREFGIIRTKKIQSKQKYPILMSHLQQIHFLITRINRNEVAEMHPRELDFRYQLYYENPDLTKRKFIPKEE